MGKQNTWISKHTARPHNSTTPPHTHLFPLLIASITIGILFSVLSQTQSLAQVSQVPPEATYTPIPKSDIAFANTVGAPIEQHPPIQQPAIYYASLPTTPSTTSLNADVIFSLINTIRQQNGLAPFQKDDRLCSLAASRAPEVVGEIATGTMHQGMYARRLPFWNTENIIAINSESAAVTWWMSDYIHKAAILGNDTYSCVACAGNACAQEFSSFTPK